MNKSSTVFTNNAHLFLMARLVFIPLLGAGQAALAAGPTAVDLGNARSFVILSKTGITNVPTSDIRGDIGVSPIASTAITGFSLVPDSTNTFSRSSQVTGKVYAANYASPTPAKLTVAISNMQTAYINAAGRTNPDFTELYAGNISKKTLTPGLYKWSTGVFASSNFTINGGATDIWIFQIAGTLNLAANVRFNLSGGAQAKNIFWQVAGKVTLGTGSHFEGNILGKTAIVINTGASLNGRALAQTAVTLQKNALAIPLNYELIWRNYSTGANYVWYMDGISKTAAAALPSASDVNWKIVGRPDINGDGEPDLLWRNYSTGANSVWYMKGITHIASASLPSQTNVNWKIVGTPDINADGKPDLLWRNYSTGANSVWYMNGITRIASASLPSLADVSWKIVGTPDMNADGRPDFLWRNYSTGANYVWYMKGTIHISGASLPSLANVNWKIVATHDINGDDQPDLLWRNYSTGANIVWYMKGISHTVSASLPSLTDVHWKIVNNGIF